MWTFGRGGGLERCVLCRLKCVCFVRWFVKEHGWIKCNGLPTPMTFRYISKIIRVETKCDQNHGHLQILREILVFCSSC